MNDGQFNQIMDRFDGIQNRMVTKSNFGPTFLLANLFSCAVMALVLYGLYALGLLS